MAELKRVFSGAKMNKDMDERLVPNGQYRDANNIEIATSEGSSVGTVQTILTNTARNTLDQGGVVTSLLNSGTSNILGPHNKSTCVASVAAPDRDCIYYFVSAGDYYSTSGKQSLRKDYIIEYNTVSEKSKYVFVDIFRSDTTVSASPGTTTFHIALGAGDSVNKTGIRVGMTIGSSDTEVSSIAYDTAGSLNKWKITTNKTHNLLNTNPVSFTADRVLKFSKRNIITGINILDDFIFWTDNESEPKKINIKRSIAGTGGTTLLNTDPSDAFIGDYDYFHTRIAKNKAITADAENIYTIDGGEPVEEANVTVIRKGPTQPLELEMFRTSSERVDSEGNETAITATQLQFAYASNNTSFTTETSPFAVEFVDGVHFEEKDIVLISSEEYSMSADYNIRAEIVSSNVTSPNVLYPDGFTIKILSIQGDLDTSVQNWHFKLEDTRPIFENMFPRFSYRYKYQDGEYSTFAPWSAVGFLPDEYEYLPKKGYNLGMVNQLRSLKLKGYFAKDGIRPKDLSEIDLLYKEAGKPAVYTVKTIKESDGGSEWPDQAAYPNNRGEFSIETDIIHAVVPSNQILRPWDNVPRKALAQEISANRLIYGNYLQNYTVLEDPIVNISIEQNKLSLLDYGSSAPSVKTMRKYQVGVVFSDDYGRETPVLTTKKSSITVLKDASDTRNRLVCSLDKTTPNIPEWAKYLSYYIKETSVEYYSMAMDRWYMASDGNVWISFPSSERNKLDNETFIVLKKAHGSNIAVKDKARYKILAIESEAPDHVKTQRKSLGKVLDNGNSFVGEDGQGWPFVDATFIHVACDAFEDVFGDQLHILTPDSMHLKIYGDGTMSNVYEISRLVKTGDGAAGGYYKIQLAGKFNDDISFTTTDGTYNTAIGDLVVEIIEHEVENRPEFDGRFFVKIHSDEALRKHVLVGQEENVFVSNRWKLGYLNNNGYTNPHPDSGESRWNARYDTSENLDAHGGKDYTDHTPNYDYVNNIRYVSMTGLHPTENLHHTQTTSNGGLNQNKYWWGDLNEASEGGVNSTRDHWGVTQKDIDKNPVLALNGLPEGERIGFWESVRGEYGFFIDSATVYSYTGKKNDQPGASSNPTEFPGHSGDPFEISDLWDFDYGMASAEEEQDWAERDTISNTNGNRGQLSKGIWTPLGSFTETDVSYMDISWSGLGNNSSDYGYPGSNGNRPFFHKLGDIPNGWGGDTEGDNTKYYRAGQFIEQLVAPGTKFRFARDPDRHVYEVLEDSFPTFIGGDELDPESASFGNGYNDNTSFIPGTNRYKGIWGMRNYRTEGDGNWTGANINMNKEQYQPAQYRQRWTLTVSPRIGQRGPSYYSPTTGTGGYTPNGDGTFTRMNANVPDASHGNYRRALHHDYSGPYDAIEILDIFTDGLNKGGFVSNPAVWETEPKESVELDIYYQASGLIPLELNNKTNEEYISLGSTFFSVNTGDQLATKHTVTSLDNQTVTFTPAWAGDGTGAGDIIKFTKRDNYSFEAVIGAQLGSGETSLTLLGGPNSSVSSKIAFQKQYLDWSNCWVFGNGVESDRVRDDFNTAQVDNGVKASTVLAEKSREERRKHGLIWSGIYNSNSGVNDTNQFIAAEKITKDLNPIYGSIQALLNRDTRLVMFCEDKILRGVTNKNALYNADGNPQLISSNTVIGDVTPYEGDYGISTNPESIATTPSTTYFTDAVKGRVLALSTEGVRPISDIGMKGYFSDFMSANISTCFGSYDDRKKEYNISMYKKYNAVQPLFHEQVTVSYSEISKGWVSFKSFYPQAGLSLNGNYYTFSNGGLWQHYLGNSYSTIYGNVTYSDITVLFNDQPDTSKKFMTINYEGSKQNIPAFATESHEDTYTGNSDINEGIGLVNFTDSEYYNLSAQLGWSAESFTTNLQSCDALYFKDKEGKYFSYPTGEATSLGNLDEKEFTVQGIGLANITHDDASVGNQITITLANNTSSTYKGIPGTGSAWDSGTATTETSRWSVDTAEVVNVNAGVAIGGGVTRVLTITPIVNGVYSGFPLSASNFEWSGATGASGNVWNNDGSVNADPAHDAGHITRITFTDLGQPGTASNKVTATLQFYSQATWPNASATWYVDIDDKATAPESETRDFYLKTEYDYLGVTQQVDPSITTPSGLSTAVIDAGGTSGTTSNSHSGTVLNDATTLITTLSFNRSGEYYYLGGAASPSVTFENLGDYAGSYTSSITDVVYSQPNHITNFKVKIYYTPPQSGLAIEDEATMADLGHKAIVNYVMKPPNTAVTYDITNVAHPSDLAYGAASTGVVVYGKYNASYRIFVQKKTSTTSGITSSTGGYYNFDTDLFQNTTSHEVGTISPTGMSVHMVSLPQVLSDTRYDITIEALNGPVLGTVTTLGPQVPTHPGDAVMIHKGIRTLTIKPYADVVADFEEAPYFTVAVSKPAVSSGASLGAWSSTVHATTGSAISGKTKLTLASDAQRVKSGMLVLAPFQVSATMVIPLGVTVVSVRRENIVLSTACTIPAGTELSFVSDATDLIPFTINVAAADTTNHTSFALKSNIDYRSSIGGLQSQIQVKVNGAVTNSKGFTLDSNRGIKVGMRVTGTGIVSDPAFGYSKVSGVTVAAGTDITLSNNQTLADNTLLTFSWPEDDPTLDVYDEFGGANTGVVPRHIVASITGGDTVKIEGYIQVSSITKDDTMDIYINDFVNVS